LQKRPIITYDTRPRNASTEWPRCIASFEWQVSFHKRAINYRVLLREMTYQDMASDASLLQSCTEHHTARASHHKSITLQEHHTARASHCKSITLQEHHTARASHCKSITLQDICLSGRKPDWTYTHSRMCVYLQIHTNIHTHTHTHMHTHTLPATHCQHIATQHPADTLQCTATHCNALQHTSKHRAATHHLRVYTATHCNTTTTHPTATHLHCTATSHLRVSRQ